MLNTQLAAQPREETWGLTPAPSMRVRARPPQPREDGPTRHPHRPRSGGRPLSHALVVQAPAYGVGSLCPGLIHQPLRGSLWLQLPNRQWVLCRCVDSLTIKHRRVARVLTVVRNDQSVAHERVLLSPFLLRDDAASVNPAIVLLSLAADQLSVSTSTGSAVSPEPSGPGLKQDPQQSGALQFRPSITDREWRYKRRCRRGHPSPQVVQ